MWVSIRDEFHLAVALGNPCHITKAIFFILFLLTLY
jgi:hypothetical protein